MWMTARDVRQMNLADWSGIITIHSPVAIGRRIKFDPEAGAIVARYVLRFRSGEVSILMDGRTLAIGRMELDRLELYRFGLWVESLRHLLFPHTLALHVAAESMRAVGKADSLHEVWQASEGLSDALDDESEIEADPTQRCRFWNLRAAFLFWVDVHHLRYWVRESV